MNNRFKHGFDKLVRFHRDRAFLYCISLLAALIAGVETAGAANVLAEERSAFGSAPGHPPRILQMGQILTKSENRSWATVEGVVTFVSNSGNNCWNVELSSNTRTLRAELVARGAEAKLISFLKGGRVRVSGFCGVARDLLGEPVFGVMEVPGLRDIVPLELAPNQWQSCPLQTIAGVREASTNSSAMDVTHLRGKVLSIVTNDIFELADSTGRILIQTTQLLPPTGECVEVLGLRHDDSPKILYGIYHSLENLPTDNSGKLPVLTSVEQVRRLKPAEAGRRYPVKLQAVIINRDAREDDHKNVKDYDQVAVIQDATAPIYVWLKSAGGKAIQVGHYCEMEGTTEAGGFAPMIVEKQTMDLGPGEMPRPLHPNLGELTGGSLDCDWVEVEGILRPTGPIGLQLLMRDGHVNLRVCDVRNPSALKAYMNALVRVRGCVFPYRDSRGQVTGGALVVVPSLRFISLEQAAPDLFGLPLSQASDLLGFKPQDSFPTWVKLAGQIAHVRGKTVFLLNGAHGVRCVLQSQQSVQPGDEAEVVGLSEMEGSTPLLREAVLRQTGHASLPAARKVNVGDILPIRQEGTFIEQAGPGVRDAMRVQLEGRLVSARVRNGEIVMEMQSGVRVFEAVLAGVDNAQSKLPPFGSRLALSGVVSVLRQSANGDVDAFELLLNSAGDITCLELPPRWTLKEALTLIAGLAVVVVLALSWILLLRRRVDQRTRQLRAEMEERRHAEKRVQQLEMQTALEEERVRIARDIHDELGARATKIGSLAAAVNTRSLSRNFDPRLADIYNASQQLIRALDETVWTVNPSNDSLSELLDYLTHFAEEFFRDTPIRCHLKIPVDLPDCPMSTELRHGLLAIVKESLNNALKHSGADTVVIRARKLNHRLQLIIQDNGKGFSPDDFGNGNGIANLRGRARTLDAQLEIDSQADQGTRIMVEVPLMDTPARFQI